MSNVITAQQVINRIRIQLRSSWKNSTIDVIHAGNPETVVSGIATSYTPSIDVLRKAVDAGNNLIITQQPAYYQETEEYLKNDQTYLYKKDFIETNKLVVWRFYDNWNNRDVDGQLFGLAKALGWDQYHIANAGEQPYHKKNKYFILVLH